MQCNIGRSDKITRFVVGLVILFLGAFYQQWWGFLGVIPIFTATIGYCPLYSLFGISTNKQKTSPQPKRVKKKRR